MEAVDILVDCNGLKHLGHVDMRGQGKLDEDAVDILVSVQLRDAAEQRFVGDVSRITVREGTDADIFTRLDFLADINGRGRIFTDEDHSQTRCHTMLGQRPHAGCAFLADFCGKFFPVDQLG